MKKKVRHMIQAAAAVFFNGYAAGFVKGKIFRGKTKAICVPVLNCYSCPGAVGACPIGSLQAVLGSRNSKFSFYVLGTILLFGVILGRAICGFLCPFGFIQELIYKIKTPKVTVPKKLDRPLRYLKYAVLIVLVIVLPLFLTNEFGMGDPYFCKWLCPAGTLEGGLPLVLMNDSLKKAIGFLFSWKVGILVVILILSVLIYRPFCKYLCPLGAFYGLFNRISFVRLAVDRDQCVECGLCEKNCKMNVPVRENINSPECIRCGECKAACPKQAISLSSLAGNVRARKSGAEE
ncbi:MAG: 4Fe-4S binding protein [Oscillospiraceae bacterium]|nr:4Fe-4S binding protein [Oscillospiraceae bacterium]